MSTAQAVLAKRLPQWLRVTPKAGGGWTIEGTTDYSNVLRELGLTAVQAELDDGAKPSATHRRR
jgi:hypothetical protein